MIRKLRWGSSLLGLDIRPHEIRWLCLWHGRKEIIIENFGIFPCPWSKLEELHWNLLETSLTKLVHEHALKRVSAAIALSSRQTWYGIFSVPLKISTYQLEEAVQAEVQNAQSLDRKILHTVFSYSGTENTSNKNIIWSAARKDHLLAYVQHIEQA